MITGSDMPAIYTCYFFGPFPPPYWWRRVGIMTYIVRRQGSKRK
jgi:hypothetical protein